MVQSYDFIVHAINDEDFRNEIINHINNPYDNEMIYNVRNALLKFDSKNQKIIETSCDDNPKLWDMEISYQDFIKVMETNDASRYDILGASCKFLK